MRLLGAVLEDSPHNRQSMAQISGMLPPFDSCQKKLEASLWLVCTLLLTHAAHPGDMEQVVLHLVRAARSQPEHLAIDLLHVVESLLRAVGPRKGLHTACRAPSTMAWCPFLSELPVCAQV